MTATASKGYWLVTADGTVRSFGGAPNLRVRHRCSAGQTVVGIAATPDGGGYWIVTSHGDVLAFGDAHYYGSTANRRLAAPIVGITSTPDGHGYWLVASDGGVFCFGDAGIPRLDRQHAAEPAGGRHRRHAERPGLLARRLRRRDLQLRRRRLPRLHGSHAAQPPGGRDDPDPGRARLLARRLRRRDLQLRRRQVPRVDRRHLRLAAPMVGMASPVSSGYWLVASDGGIFSFGVPFHGSMA